MKPRSRLHQKPMSMPPATITQRKGREAQQLSLLSLTVNLVLALMKGLAGILGNSYALIADALESLLDVFSSVVVWSGLRIAVMPPDEDHPYGHGKAEPLAAAVVAIVLVSAAIGLTFQSIHEIITPHHAPESFTLVVLVLVVIVKESMFRFLNRGGARLGSMAVRSDAWHHRSDALTSAAAFVGISIALIGGEGYESSDDWAALFACVVIAYNGYKLLAPAVGEIMDVAPSPAIVERVRALARAVDGVDDLDVCTIRKMGFEYFVDLHVLVNGDLPVRRGHLIAHNVKDAILAGEPSVRDVLIHIEPSDLPQYVKKRSS